MRGSILELELIICLLTRGAMAGTGDPFAGTWKLDAAKSKTSDPGMMPRSEILRSQASVNRVKLAADGIESDGRSFPRELSASFDGREYPMTGTPHVAAAALRRADAAAMEFEDQKAGKQVGATSATVSQNTKIRSGSSPCFVFAGIRAE